MAGESDCAVEVPQTVIRGHSHRGPPREVSANDVGVTNPWLARSAAIAVAVRFTAMGTVAQPEMTRSAARGAAVEIFSGHHEQLLVVCHRVVILHEGSAIAELSANELTESALFKACDGNSTGLE